MIEIVSGLLLRTLFYLEQTFIIHRHFHRGRVRVYNYMDQ